MKIWPIQQQQSEEWFEARRGKPTASRFDQITTPTGKPSSARKTLALELCAELVRPAFPDEMFTGNKHTDRGNELEPIAREEFTTRTGYGVEQVGFITRDDGIVGCSPDAVIRNQKGQIVAGLELKCPIPHKHAQYIVDGELPSEYKQQVHGSMAVTGLKTWFFMSYCRGFKPFILRVEWDSYTDTISKHLDDFLIYYAEIQTEVMPKLRIHAAREEEEAA